MLSYPFQSNFLINRFGVLPPSSDGQPNVLAISCLLWKLLTNSSQEGISLVSAMEIMYLCPELYLIKHFNSLQKKSYQDDRKTLAFIVSLEHHCMWCSGNIPNVWQLYMRRSSKEKQWLIQKWNFFKNYKGERYYLYT